MSRKFWLVLLIVTVMLTIVTGCNSAQPTTAPQDSPTKAAEAPTEEAKATEAPAETPTEEAKATEAPAEAPTEETKASSEAPEVPAAYKELADAEAGKFKGTKVTIFGASAAEDVAGYEATFKDFAARTGIDVQYEGSKDFETLITVRAEGGNAPDIAGFPQPGLMASLAADGKILDISSFMPMDELKKSYIQSWLDLGTIDGKLSGVFYRASVKSLVWYPVKPFKDAGYEIPTTWKELETLQDKMVADGNTPWCIGLEHAGATGWVATDWLEEIVLRTAGPDTYNKWIKHEIPFNDPAIKSALDTMGKIWLSDKYVYGGPTGVLSTNVGDSPTGMFDNPPSCFLHRQAGWISSFFPEGTKVGEEADFFYFPPIDEAQGKPVLGGGDVFSMMNDRPEVRAVMQYLTTPDAAKGWIKNGGFISPLKTVPLDWYTNPVERKQAEIMQQATVFGFDASDLMPASVGTGTFWKGMVDYVGGTDPDAVLQTIEDSWPADATGQDSSGTTDNTKSDEASLAAPAAYKELADAEAGKFKGTKVTIFGASAAEDVAGYEATFKDFAARTGIDVQYEGSKDFETLITVRAEGGNAPDIAGFPQPGLMASLAADGKILDISSFLPQEELEKSYIQSWLDLGTIDGKLSGVFYRASVKSLVWYPVKPFKDAGYEIPTTWKELETLQDKMVADGNTPWCIGLEHAGATGWVATDWLEEIVLRTAGPDTYNQWIKHEIPFNDPAIKSALDTMGKIWLSDKYVYGGPTGVLSTNVGDSPTGMFDNPPSCFLHRQAGWISSFFPEGTKVGEDADFFYFPPIDEAQGKPVLGGGDVFSMMNDRPEVRAVMQYLTTPDAAKGWIKNGGFISPLKTVPLDWYTNPVERKQAEIMQQATVFGFDASDLMPASVGTGTFWKGMVDYVGGTDPDTVLQTIEDSWPKK